MLSVASVASAGGAANYFAKDDYYVGDGPAELSEWGGKGAEALGLAGPVAKDDFEKVLDGKLPDDTVVNGNANRRSGIDLTFSMPKSASLLAQLGGDKRILDAQLAAVKATMAYLEKHYAQARDRSRNANGEGVVTGKLLYALFQHDTSRALDPQNHTHAVIAAITLTSCAASPAPQADFDPDAVIIDVRTPAEHATGHLDGALLLDVTGGELQAALPDLDAEAAYLVYCRSGNRARAAIDRMKQAGFTDLRNLGSLEDAASATGLSIVQP